MHLITCVCCDGEFDEQNPAKRSSIEAVCQNCAGNAFFYCPECDHTRHTDDIAYEIRRLVGSEAAERHPEVFWGLCRDHVQAKPAQTVLALREGELDILEYRFFRGGVMGVGTFRHPFVYVRRLGWLGTRTPPKEEFYLTPSGDWREAVKADAVERGYRINNIPDLKNNDTVWAVVTPDGVPTRCRVVSFHKAWIVLKSIKTGLFYDSLCDRVYTSFDAAKRFGTYTSVEELAQVAEQDSYLIVEVNVLGEPICALQWTTSQTSADAAAEMHRRRRPHHIQIIPVKEVLNYAS